MLVGEKRYLLLPPAACSDLSLLPYGHPSARHSKIMLAKMAALGPDGLGNLNRSLTGSDQDAPPTAAEIDRFLSAHALDVHLSPGDVLHLPAYWFHAVLSLTQTVQCNSFVGGPSTTVAQDHVEDCMMMMSGELRAPPSSHAVHVGQLDQDSQGQQTQQRRRREIVAKGNGHHKDKDKEL